MRKSVSFAALPVAFLAGCATTPNRPAATVGHGGAAASAPETPRAADSNDLRAPEKEAPWWLLDSDAARPELLPDSDADKSYLIPAVEIVVFEILLNFYNREFSGEEVYDSDSDSIHRNLHSGWSPDRDPFAVNQLGHPYAGSVYHGFARSAGLNYWESLGYTFVGSAIWEIAGERSPPSLNDQIATGIGGSFLGEALYRTATWVLGNGEKKPGFVDTVSAAALSPSAAFNRFAYRDRFRAAAPTTDPVVMTRVGIGAKTNTHVDDQGRSNTKEDTSVLAEFVIDYGLPGASGYAYSHPFDYFHFEVGGLSDSHNHVDRAIARGILLGDEYEAGDDYRGVWGLYGSYDYISPGIFRVASTALSIGTTGEDWLSDRIVLRGTVLGGIGFGAAGTVSDDDSQRDYHYGEIPQALLDLSLVFGERAILQFTGRDYYAIGGAYNDNEGDENIAQLSLALTTRISGPHALSLQYTYSNRDSKYSRDFDQEQTVESLSLVYSFLGGAEFGATR